MAGRAGLRAAAPPHYRTVGESSGPYPALPPAHPPAAWLPKTCAAGTPASSGCPPLQEAGRGRVRPGECLRGGGWWEGSEGERKNRSELKRGGASAGITGTKGRGGNSPGRGRDGWGVRTEAPEETGSFCLSTAEDNGKWSDRPEF